MLGTLDLVVSRNVRLFSSSAFCLEVLGLGKRKGKQIAMAGPIFFLFERLVVGHAYTQFPARALLIGRSCKKCSSLLQTPTSMLPRERVNENGVSE